MLERPVDVPAVPRRAADRFCSSITLTTKDVFFSRGLRHVNVISSLPYEGSETIGEVVFAPPASAEITIRVQFRRPVSLSRHRLARKVIEMSAQNLSCVCHGSEGISGLGTLTTTNSNNVFRVVFTGNYAWDLYHKGVLQMRSAFGVPKLPMPRLNWEQFHSTAQRIFADFGWRTGDDSGASSKPQWSKDMGRCSCSPNPQSRRPSD